MQLGPGFKGAVPQDLNYYRDKNLRIVEWPTGSGISKRMERGQSQDHNRYQNGYTKCGVGPSHAVQPKLVEYPTVEHVEIN